MKGRKEESEAKNMRPSTSVAPESFSDSISNFRKLGVLPQYNCTKNQIQFFFLLYTKIIRKFSHYKIEDDESAEITGFISMIYKRILGGDNNFFFKKEKKSTCEEHDFLKMSGYFSSRRHRFDCFESLWKGCFHLPSIHPFHFRLLLANCLPPLCHSVCCLTSETESLYTALLSVLVRSAVSVCVSVSVWYSVSKWGCLSLLTRVRVRVHSRGNGWRLQLILAMWHFANLISLACSGQRAQIDAVYVRACVRTSNLQGPVESTTLSDGSSDGIGEKKWKKRECVCVCVHVHALACVPDAIKSHGDQVSFQVKKDLRIN